MSEQTPNVNNEPQEREPYTPASFEKRAAAWMGIVYVLMLMFFITFTIFSGGKSLPGTFPLLLVPVAAAAIVVSVYRQSKGTAPGGMALTVFIVILCLAAIVFGLLLGVPALVAALQTAFP